MLSITIAAVCMMRLCCIEVNNPNHGRHGSKISNIPGIVHTGSHGPPWESIPGLEISESMSYRHHDVCIPTLERGNENIFRVVRVFRG